MKLLTKELEDTLPNFYDQEDLGNEAIVHVKFFTPDANWTWYVTEYNREDKMFFGLVKGHFLSMGYFSLTELEEARGPLGLPVERDLYFDKITVGNLKKQLDI